MKELEELTADIREKLPRLKELKAGIFIIWKDPTLNDVMEWLKVKSQLDFDLGDKRLLTHFLAFKIHEWDLSKSYLKDQSSELIKYLHGLIK